MKFSCPKETFWDSQHLKNMNSKPQLFAESNKLDCHPKILQQDSLSFSPPSSANLRFLGLLLGQHSNVPAKCSLPSVGYYTLLSAFGSFED